MKGPLFFAKILLFGEYGIIEDSKGLSIPYNFYRGALKIPKNKIGEVIGKGGANIKKLTEETNTNIDISDNGSVKIYGRSKEEREDALQKIEFITSDPEVGLVTLGTVEKIVDFGAFVSFDNGREGLVHISEISEERVKNIADYLVEGEEVEIKVIGIDDRGKVKLSMKEVSSE